MLGVGHVSERDSSPHHAIHMPPFLWFQADTLSIVSLWCLNGASPRVQQQYKGQVVQYRGLKKIYSFELRENLSTAGTFSIPQPLSIASRYSPDSLWGKDAIKVSPSGGRYLGDRPVHKAVQHFSLFFSQLSVLHSHRLDKIDSTNSSTYGVRSLPYCIERR
jgi:hypothetical protein